MKSFAITIVTLLVISSCSSEADIKYLDAPCASNTKYQIDTPKGGYLFHAIRVNNKYLTLSDISTPSDTFYIRIGKANKKEAKIFEYKVHGSTQSIKIYQFPCELDGQMRFDKNIDKLENFTTVFNGQAKSLLIITKLKENNILELPSSYEIKGYPVSEIASNVVTIEYSNKCRYKLIYFINPYGNKEFKQAEKLSFFLKYLEKEFGF